MIVPIPVVVIGASYFPGDVRHRENVVELRLGLDGARVELVVTYEQARAFVKSLSKKATATLVIEIDETPAEAEVRELRERIEQLESKLVAEREAKKPVLCDAALPFGQRCSLPAGHDPPHHDTVLDARWI